jgi:hypothetical protein
VEFILGHMSLKQKAICGLPHKTGQELLYLPPPSSQSDLRHMGYYLMLLVDEFGNVIWVYDGSGTSIYGAFTRIVTYDNVKHAGDAGVLVPEDAKGEQLRTLLNKGYTVHIRPIFLVRHDEASAARVVSVEAQITDIFNTFDIDGDIHGSYRSQKVFDEYEEGVSDDMKDVEYGKLNRAHQLTQGRKKGPSPPCVMIGKGCQQKDGSRSKATTTSLAYTSEGNQVYMCVLCKQCWLTACCNHPHENIQDTINYFFARMQERHTARPSPKRRGLRSYYSQLVSMVQCCTRSTLCIITTTPRILAGEFPKVPRPCPLPGCALRPK